MLRTFYFIQTPSSDAVRRHVYTDFLQRGIIPRLIHRESTGTACAYIICSEATGSRTIISHLNSLADPTAAELEREVTWPDWIHVEGRNCVEVLRFIKAIKERGWEGRVSVDFEIPREGLRELVPVADVLFISRAFANSVAEAAGDTFKPRRVHAGSREPEAAAFVRGVMDTLGDEMQLGAEGHFLMGDAGSFCFLWDKEYPVLGFKENTPLERPIVETIGAGDTFIAAALWGGLRGLNLVQVNDLATRIARKKIVAIGFKGLWHGESVVGYSKYTWDPDAALN